MHVLFDIGHPAHVHLFRVLARRLLERGDQVTITIRDRGIIGYLLSCYGLPYSISSRPRQGLAGLAIELAIHDWGVLRASLASRPDFLVGTSVSAAHVGKFIGRPSIILNEDDADYVPLFARLAYGFATRIVTPSILRDTKTFKYRCHNSYHELAYLHPNHFIPDSTVLEQMRLGLDEPFSIVRLVSLLAHHDVGEQGISIEQAERLVAQLARYGRVFVSGEAELPASLMPYAFRAPPEQMHSLLAFAQLLVSDSQTMTMEAAVLGTPAMRCNTFVGRCSVISEIEEHYRLAWGFRPSQFDAMCDEIDRLLTDPATKVTFADRRATMLEEKCDLSEWLLHELDSGFV